MTGPQGRLVAVVGPSGVGKDSLLALAREAFADRPELLFVRRTITRPATGDAEAHLPMSREEFDRAEAEGAFAFCWRAHGLGYGLPAALGDHLQAGRPAVVNGSRKVLAKMAERFPGLAVISITASPEVLARRLSARGRESASEIADRIARASEPLPVEPAAIIDNSGTLADAGRQMVAAIHGLTT